jgi:hypothetical protein
MAWIGPPWPLVAGRTAPVRWRLSADGTPIALAGLTLTLYMSDRNGTVVVTATVANGKLVVVDDGTEPLRGIVDFYPVAEDFTVAGSPYRLRYRLVDGTGKIDHYPDSRDAPQLVVGAET